MLVFAAYFAVFMEWLFYVTKPSFMGAMSFPEKLAILAIASLAAAAPGLALIAVLWILNLAPLGPRAWKVFLYAGAVIPTAYLAAAFLLLIDNFTYTVFHFGVLTSQGSQRGMYAVLLGVLWLVSIWWIIRGLSRRARQKRFNPALRAELGLCAVLLVLSVIIGWTLFQAPRASVQVPIGSGSAARPNILLIGSDGLDADHMSLYNDQVSTTPFLKAFSQTALLSENNFPNANETAGSLVSIFTGRLPTATRTLYPPDILQGADAFQHFPEILKSAGYYNADLSVDYYADMTNLNMQDSFVTINGRSNTLGSLYTLTREVIPEDAAYFLSTVAKGLSDRVEQMLYIHTVSNPYSEV
ncbi:MAG TPA: sulfatase-like hydrolase/transferase, partial [Anaerolineaceae bacterium]